jgi:hypothetical protein
MTREEICFLLATIGHTGVTTGITFNALYEKAMDIMANSPVLMMKGTPGKRKRTTAVAPRVMHLPGCVTPDRL